MKNDKPIMESRNILFEILELEEKPQVISEGYSFENLIFYTNAAVFEECETEDHSVKINLIHNIQYDIKGVDMDGDTPIFRAFTLENQNGVRYFTALGSDYIIGRTEEHTKENFVKLLIEHPKLKNNHLVKYLNNLILSKELEDSLSISDIATKKPKI